LFINNEWVDSLSGQTFSTISPSTEEKITNVALANDQDVNRAVQAARKAFELGSEYRSLDASARGSLIYKFAQLIRRDLDYLSV
jgi:acyl-CoA reductase-like NAD-dependent aldehyde dehydrogenase